VWYNKIKNDNNESEVITMKFFDISIRNITAYGIIYSNGVFEVNMWDFSADDYRYREGKLDSMKAAWKQIHHLARDMDRFNHYLDEGNNDTVEALNDFFNYFEVDNDFDEEIADLDELTLLDDEGWA
jgi:hypothetical protein